MLGNRPSQELAATARRQAYYSFGTGPVSVSSTVASAVVSHKPIAGRLHTRIGLQTFISSATASSIADAQSALGCLDSPTGSSDPQLGAVAAMPDLYKATCCPEHE